MRASRAASLTCTLIGAVNAHAGDPWTPGDTNGDGGVNSDDLVQVILDWGPCPHPPATCPSDVAPPGGNGMIDVDDLLTVILTWS